MIIANSDLFCGIYPEGLVYADKTKEVAGDYKPIAFISFGTLELTWRVKNPGRFREEIEAKHADMMSKRGQDYQVSTSGQVVTLGWRLEKEKR